VALEEVTLVEDMESIIAEAIAAATGEIDWLDIA
jgi:hypothetical protein